MNRNRLIALVGLILALVIVGTGLLMAQLAASPPPRSTSTSSPNGDDDGDGIPDNVDQCPFQYALGDGCPATPTIDFVSGTAITQPIDTDTVTPRPVPSELPRTTEVVVRPTNLATANDAGDTPESPEPTQTKIINVPVGDQDELGSGVERAYAPYELASDEVGVVRLEIELDPTNLTPTFKPPLPATPTLAPGVTRPPTSTPLPQVAIANINVRTVMQARLAGIDISKFEILDKEPMNELRQPEAGSVSWWEWHIRPVAGIKPGVYSLYIIVFFQTKDANGNTIETTRGERLDFKIQVTDVQAGTPKQPVSPASTPLLPILAVVVILALIGGAFVWRQRSQATGTVASFLPRLLPAQPTVPFSQAICFVSYSRRDEEFVIKFTQRLRADGVNVWRDREDIPAGASWDDEIDAALQRCTHVLFVASTSSVKSDNVGDELGAALTYHKLVIPILIEDCQLPFRIRRNQWVDFRGDFESAIAKLLKDLGKGAK